MAGTVVAATANSELTVFASAARTASANSPDLGNTVGKGLHLIIDVTAVTLTPSVVFTIEGKDATSGKYYPLLVSDAIATISTVVLKLYPGITVTALAAASDILPRTWRVVATHGNANSITFSVGAVVVA